MLLHEANSRLKAQINTEQLENINSLYILLDLDKDIFCKIVDFVGIDILIKKQKWYNRLLKAEWELKAKENYIAAKQRLEELEVEKEKLSQDVANYEKTHSI